MIVRPPEYLDDVRERELEMQAAEARLHQLDHLLCPHCDHDGRARLPALPELPAQAQGPVRRTARSRWTRQWPICPYCETEVPGAIQRRRRARRRRRRESRR